MLLNTTQAHLNTVLELLDESLDLYEDMRERLPETSRRAQLDSMMQQRRELLEGLRKAGVNELQLRPRVADQEIEGLTHLLEQFRSLWQEPATVALDLLQDHERELQRAVLELHQDADSLGPTLKTLLQELDGHLAAAEVWFQH